MRARDIFELVARIAGLGLVIAGAIDALDVIVLLLGLPNTLHGTAATAGVGMGVYLVTGLPLLLGGRWLAGAVYRSES